MTKEMLLNKGFAYEEFPDGYFYYLEKRSGDEAEHIAHICSINAGEYDGYDVGDIIDLQCDDHFDNPCLFCDGNVWDLSKEEFESIVSNL